MQTVKKWEKTGKCRRRQQKVPDRGRLSEQWQGVTSRMTLRSFSCSSSGAVRRGNSPLLSEQTALLLITFYFLLILYCRWQTVALSILKSFSKCCPYIRVISPSLSSFRLCPQWCTQRFSTMWKHFCLSYTFFFFKITYKTTNHTFFSWLEVHVADCTVCSVASCCDKAGFVWHPK